HLFSPDPLRIDCICAASRAFCVGLRPLGATLPSRSDYALFSATRPTMSAIVEIVDVEKDYPLGTTVVCALKGVNLESERGEFETIAGTSGSGKTSVLNLIGCIDVATSGKVVIDGHSTRELSDRALTQLRLHTLGFIFQSFNLIDVLNV